MNMRKFPEPTGEYAVGTFTFTVKDVREEALRPGTLRSVAARVWYPVRKESTEGLPGIRALSESMLKAFRSTFLVAPDFRRHPERNESACYADAPRIPGERFPLILFSHGYSSYREGNSFLCIELASHGYAVISVAHSLEAMCTEFDDGSVLFYDKRLTGRMYSPIAGGILAMLRLTKAGGSDEELAARFDAVQRKYCRFMMERLPQWVKDMEAALGYAREHLSDLIDFRRGVGASGHSMGGNTAYALCAEDPQVVCGVNIDGALFGDYSRTVQRKPFLQISCGDNERAETRAFLRHTAPVYKALFRDMKHIGFSDAKHMIPWGAVTGRLDPDEMHAALCRCHLEFFDAYLKGKKEAPALESGGAVTVTVYPPDL